MPLFFISSICEYQQRYISQQFIQDIAMRSTKDKLSNFIEEMAHFDPDNMEMGAKAVTELVVSGDLNLEDNPNTADSIRQAFMKQMESDNYNVHAYAIRCVAEIIPNLPSQQIDIIFAKIISSISDKQLNEKKRQIYARCAGTVIHQASDQNGKKLRNLFVESIKQLMKSKDQKHEIEVILINVISEYLRKWPSIASSQDLNYNRKELIVYLLKNIQMKSRLQIIKKSETAIGKLTLILKKNDLEVLLEDSAYGILNHIQSHFKGGNEEDMKQARNALFCLANALKTHNSDLKYWALKIVNIMVDIINHYKANVDIDRIDLTSDIIESAVICLTFTVKSYSRELQKIYIQPVNCLNNFVNQLINFDAEGMMTYCSSENIEQNKDNQDGGYDYYDCYEINDEVDERSWKVRRAIVNYIAVLIKKDKHFRDNVSKTKNFISQLGLKLVENNLIVSQAALGAFNSLLETITANKTNTIEDDLEQLTLKKIKTNQGNLAMTLSSEIASRIVVIFNNSIFSDAIKIQASRLILRIIHIGKEEILVSNLVRDLITTFTQQVKKANVTDIISNLLLSLRDLVSNYNSYNFYEETVSTVIAVSQSKKFKVVSSAYKCLRTLLENFSREINHSSHSSQIIANIKNRLKEHDADRLVKTNVIKCVGPIFKNFILNSDDQQELLSLMNKKLRIQIEKSFILQQLSVICFKPNKNSIPILKQILLLSTESLGSSSYDLNFQAVQCTTAMLRILQGNLNTKIVDQVLDRTKILFSEEKIPGYIHILLDKYPKMFTAYTDYIVKAADSSFIRQMINSNIINVTKCVSILKSINNSEKEKKISELLAKIGVKESDLLNQIDESLWGKICIGAIGYIGNEKTANILIDLILTSKSEDLQFAASSSLGNLASRHQSQLIPRIMKQVQKTQQFYIFMYSLKEMLNFTNEVSQIGDLTEWLFKKADVKYDGESIYYILSECIGKLAFKSERQLMNIVSNCNLSDNMRFVLANSLRFALENKTEIMESESIESYIKIIMKLMSDTNLQVRYGAAKSLNTIATFNYKSIKCFINDSFWEVLRKNCQIDSSLVVVVDYGISKEKKDTGKPLRLQSFNLMKNLVGKMSLQQYIIEGLMVTCLDNLNKQASFDIVLKRLTVLKNLCQVDLSQFITHQNTFISKLGLEDEGILKSYQVQRNTTDERQQVYVKAILKEVLEINEIAEKENIDQIRGFIAQLKTVPRLSNLLEHL